MSNYFLAPNSFRIVDPKKVPGERARKKCREWNKLVKQRNRLKKEKKFEEALEIENKLLNDF